MAKPKRPQVVNVEADGEDIFVIADGVKIAKRGPPGTADAGTWISLKPGYTVTSPPDHAFIEIFLHGERIH